MKREQIIESTRGGFVVGDPNYEDNLVVNEDKTTNNFLYLDMYDANLWGADYNNCTPKYKQKIISQLANYETIKTLRQNGVTIAIDGETVLRGKKTKPLLVQIGDLRLPKQIKNNKYYFDMNYASIQYGKYLSIAPAGIHGPKKCHEPICLKFVITMHKRNGTPYQYQFTNGEITKILSGGTVTKHTNDHIVDFDFWPFAKYPHQKRPTTGVLNAELNWNDPTAIEQHDADLSDAMYGFDGLLG